MPWHAGPSCLIVCHKGALQLCITAPGNATSAELCTAELAVLAPHSAVLRLVQGGWGRVQVPCGIVALRRWAVMAAAYVQHRTWPDAPTADRQRAKWVVAMLRHLQVCCSPLAT